MKYLRTQVLKAAEKKAVGLRKVYEGREDLVENEEIIRQYVDDVLALVRPTTRLESANDATLVFEAVNENPALKVKLLSQIAAENAQAPWFFTNTSSIPIHELDDAVKLGGRIVGFHFYNPPAVQKLVEVIRADSTLPEVGEFAQQFAKRLRKTVVPSHDVAGFIGNGHFMRDALLRDRRGRASGRGARLPGRGLRRQQGHPGLPHPADGHLPAHRLRRPGRLPVHHEGHGRPAPRARSSTAPSWTSTSRPESSAASTPTARRRTGC